MTETPWADVGDAVRTRREQLGMTQLDLARAADLSETTVRVLETARRDSYRRSNLRAIARALSWPDDAIDRIRAGRPPDEQLIDDNEGTLEERLAQLEAELLRLREAIARQRT